MRYPWVQESLFGKPLEMFGGDKQIDGLFDAQIKHDAEFEKAKHKCNHAKNICFGHVPITNEKYHDGVQEGKF